LGGSRRPPFSLRFPFPSLKCNPDHTKLAAQAVQYSPSAEHNSCDLPQPAVRFEIPLRELLHGTKDFEFYYFRRWSDEAEYLGHSCGRGSQLVRFPKSRQPQNLLGQFIQRTKLENDSEILTPGLGPDSNRQHQRSRRWL
jgi:hypothetical protein